ncbi:polysaccharide pyruvyl transferase family protein [Mediterraneibacter gnavus]|uniref:polysaccharide pyruvyl transferase family protein n=1 Tax=Mediterraneibacter gnavus TaxID=33038 RepID=UPI0016435E98|nr:polysaccharide pyruvyl transferase family protein [Mediterraneibacter gnavus]
MKDKTCVGTLTFHQSDNYGAVLQAYALQKCIDEMGFNTKVINYYSEGIAYWNRQVSIKDGLSLHNIKNYIWQRINRNKKKNFELFRSKLRLTSLYTKENIKNVLNETDKIIVGSDQVWNCDCTHEDYTYMLDFLPDDFPSYSYAASFGYRDIAEKYKKKTISLLKRFNGITVREQKASAIIEEYLDISVPVVVDPVLLLEKEIWGQLIKPIEKRYIFVYQAEKQPELIELAKNIAKKRKCPIYIVSTVWRGTVGRNVKNVSDCSPEMFLSYLKNAEVVITNSFHGTAFSILFNKEFWVQPLSRNNTNSRIDSILALMGLEQRKTLETDVNDTVGIEYDVVNTRLDIFRENSLSILKSMLV